MQAATLPVQPPLCQLDFFQQSLVLIVGSNPEPQIAIGHGHGQRTVSGSKQTRQ
jgi:hypothetical protein